MSQITKTTIATLSIFLFFNITFAQVYINEIMYNPQGTDYGREWIEICASADFDLDGLIIKDGDKERQTQIEQGTSLLKSGHCAIVSGNKDKFLSDYPSYSGIIIKSSISLLNSGDSLSLIKTSKTYDSIAYKASGKSNGEGESLHRNGNEFVSALPTPGKIEFNNSGAQAIPADSDKTNKSNETVQYANITEIPIYKFKTVEIQPPEDIFIRAKEKITVHEHEKFHIDFELFDSIGKELKNYSFTAYLGDGSKSSGKSVAHSYKKKGKYMIMAEASKDGLSDRKFVQVEVLPFSLTLSVAKDSLEIINNSELPFNLESYAIYCGPERHIFKDPLYIAGSSKISFDLRELFSFCSSSARKDISLRFLKDKLVIRPSKNIKKENGQENTKLGNNYDNPSSKERENTDNPTASASLSEDKKDKYLEQKLNPSASVVVPTSVSKQSKMSLRLSKDTILGKSIDELKISPELLDSKDEKSASAYKDKLSKNNNPNKARLLAQKGDENMSESKQHKATAIFSGLGFKEVLFYLIFLAGLSYFVYALSYSPSVSLKQSEFDDWEFEEQK